MSLTSIAAASRSGMKSSIRSSGFPSRFRRGGGGPRVPKRLRAVNENGPRGVPPISLLIRDLDDSSLLIRASFQDHEAREEVLRRHIMDVDNVDYYEACDTFSEIVEYNLKGQFIASLPYKIGITTAALTGIITIPMVFHLPTIEWFNEWAVTTDIPEARDLETPLEVSIWSWNWMEPPLGTMSFLLLCAQYAR